MNAGQTSASGEFRLTYWKFSCFGIYMLRKQSGLVGFYAVVYFCGGYAARKAGLLQSQIVQGLSKRAGGLSEMLFSWIFLLLASILLPILSQYIQAMIDGRLANYIRSRTFQRVMEQPLAYFHLNDPGKLQSLVNQMTIEGSMVLRQALIDPVLNVLLSISACSMLFSQFPGKQIGIPIAIILAALIGNYMVTVFGARLRGVSGNLQIRMLYLSSLVNGAAQSPEEIQVMNAESIFQRKFSAGLDKFLEAGLRQSIVIGTINVMGQAPGALVTIALMAWALLSPGTQAGGIVAIISLAPLAIGPFQQIGAAYLMVTTNWSSLERVIGVLESPEYRHVETGTISGGLADYGVAVRDVYFSYQKSNPGSVYRGLSCDFPSGRITGLAGRMGSGKTTLFRLVLRFYDPDSGEILLGGRPLTEYTAAYLRTQISMMTQFPAFFDDTIRENLRIARPEASDEEILDVCERTGALKILMEKFPDAGRNILDANLMAGKMLSGGERKVLALSRCLLKNPMIVFLDEPTTGIDNHEKFWLLEVLQKSVRGKTVVVVDHDVNWLLNFCDNFVELEKGRAMNQGSPAELLRSDGLLRELYLQAAGPNGIKVASWVSRG